MKRCSSCKQEKPLAEFYKHRGMPDGHHCYCKPCGLEKTTAWQKANRDTQKETARRAYLKKTYGITPETYDAMLEAQGGVCAICHRTCMSYKRLAVDHDHDSGRVRGLLCLQCNAGLGNFYDDPEQLQKAIDYLNTGA